MQSVFDSLKIKRRLSGERLEIWKKARKTDVILGIVLGIVLFVSVSTSQNTRTVSIVILLVLICNLLYRIAKKQTLWQLRRLEVKAGKNESQAMLADMLKAKGRL